MNKNAVERRKEPIIREDSEDFARDVEFILARERGSFGRRNPPRKLPITEPKIVHNRIWDKLSNIGILPEQIRHRMAISEQIRSETAIANEAPLGETPYSLQIKHAYASTFAGDVLPYIPRLHHIQQSGPNCLIFSTVMAIKEKVNYMDILSSAIQLYPNVVRTFGTIKPAIESLQIKDITVEEMELLPYIPLSISAFTHYLDQGKTILVAIETPLKLWGALQLKTETQHETVGHAIVIEGYGYSSKDELLFFLQDPFLPDGPTPVQAQSLIPHLKNRYLTFSENPN